MASVCLNRNVYKKSLSGFIMNLYFNVIMMRGEHKI